MKVVHFDLAPIFRGGQRQALLLHRGLLAAGIDSCLAVDARGRLRQKAEADGVGGLLPLEISRARPDALGRLLSMRSVARLLRNAAADIVHFHEPASLIYRPLARGALTVHTRRVSHPIRPRSVRLKYRPLGLHVGVSDEISDYLRSLGLAPVHTVRSAIDLARFDRAPAQRPLAGRERFRLLYIGAFHRMKGIDVLRDAFMRVAADPGIELHLVGDGELLPEFRTALASAGLADRALFHGFREDTESFLADADAVLVTSTYGEGSNGIIKEAMASGRAVIASDLACNRELLEHGVDGLLFRNGDVDDLVARIRMLQRREWSADVAHLRARAARYAEGGMCTAYLELYRHYLGAGAAQAPGAATSIRASSQP